MLRVVEEKRMTEVIHGLRSQNINDVLVEKALSIIYCFAIQDKWNRLLRMLYINVI